jgi:hypothetical protein
MEICLAETGGKTEVPGADQGDHSGRESSFYT